MVRLDNKILIGAVLTSVILLTFVLSNSVVAQAATKTVKIYPIVNDPNTPLLLPPLLDKYTLKCYNGLAVITCPAGISKAGALRTASDGKVITTNRNNDHQDVDLEKNKLPKGATGITLTAKLLEKKTSTNPTKGSSSWAKGGEGVTTPVIIDLPKIGFSLTNGYQTWSQPWPTDPFGGNWDLDKVNNWVEPDGKKLRDGAAHNTDSKAAEIDQLWVEATFTEAAPTISISVDKTSVAPNEVINLSGQATNQYFTDKARINWRGGTPSTEDVVIAFTTPGTFSATHSYTAGGTYQVTAELMACDPTCTTRGVTSNTVTITVKSTTELRNLTIDPASPKWGNQATAKVTLWNTDTNGPVVGEQVTFSGSAIVGTPTANTDINGVATTPVTTVSSTGQKQLVASYGGSSSFSAATNTPLSIFVTLLQHQPKFAPGWLSILGVTSINNPGFVYGQIIDPDNGDKTVSDLAVTFVSTKLNANPPPTTLPSANTFPPATTGRTTITDPLGLSVGGAITVNEGTKITFPYDPTGVKLGLIIGAPGGDLTISIESNDPNNPGPTETNPYTLPSLPAGAAEPILPDGNGIKSITLSDIPGTTIAITGIVTDINGKVTQELTSADSVVVTGNAVTLGDAVFGSASIFAEAGNFQLNASSASTPLYLASLDDNDATVSSFVDEDPSGLGAGSGVSFNGKMFLPDTCGSNNLGIIDDTSADTYTGGTDPDTNTSPDNDGDSICDRDEKDGTPFKIFDYSDGTSRIEYLPLGVAPASEANWALRVNNKDIIVEQDYMTSGSSTHKLLPEAVTMVKNAFNATGVTLTIIDSDFIPEVAFSGNVYTTIFTDNDLIWGNDFNSIKVTKLGELQHRVGVSFYNPSDGAVATDVQIAKVGTGCTGNNIQINFTGIKFTNPTTAVPYNSDISGTLALAAKFTHPSGITISVNSISVSDPANNIYLGTPSSRVDTVSSTVKTINIFAPFSAKEPISTPEQVGNFTVTITEATSCSFSGTTVANLPTDVSAISSAQEAIAKSRHYYGNFHTPAVCVNPTTTPLSSGRSEMPGNDMTTTLACGPFALNIFGHRVGDKNDQAGTFTHEMLHNLNENHATIDKLKVAEKGFTAGQSPAWRADNCLPYPNVMGYNYQTAWKANKTEAGGFWSVFISNGTLPDIDEAALKQKDAANGGYPAVGGNPKFLWYIGATNKTGTDAFDGGTIDWNLDGDLSQSTVSQDINDYNIFNCENSAPGAVGAKVYKNLNTPQHWEYNLQTTSTTYLDAGVFTGPSYGFSYLDNTLGTVQDDIRNSHMEGFVPPPDPLGTSTRNVQSATPLKFFLLRPDGTLITYGEGVAVITKNTTGNIVVPIGEIGPFVFGTQHHDYTWQVTTGPGVYYITLYMIVPVTNERVVLFDTAHPALYDAQGTRVSGIMTFTP